MIVEECLYLKKKSFKRVAFSWSSVYTAPLCSIGGTVDLVLGEINDFKIVHQSLEEIEPDFNLSEILSVCVFLASLIMLTTLLRSFLNLFQLVGKLVSFAFLYARLRFLINLFI